MQCGATRPTATMPTSLPGDDRSDAAARWRRRSCQGPAAESRRSGASPKARRWLATRARAPTSWRLAQRKITALALGRAAYHPRAVDGRCRRRAPSRGYGRCSSALRRRPSSADAHHRRGNISPAVFVIGAGVGLQATPRRAVGGGWRSDRPPRGARAGAQLGASFVANDLVDHGGNRRRLPRAQTADEQRRPTLAWRTTSRTGSVVTTAAIPGAGAQAHHGQMVSRCARG